MKRIRVRRLFLQDGGEFFAGAANDCFPPLMFFAANARLLPLILQQPLL